ncbi:allatostatin-A receptor isoform X1 [Drosophila gunungcola]|uniref:allatostatin-A receptor isoform X1 n=1 Tax=Drosophila gunungcola TaxID=103775 RepID=UPI0022E6BE8E|nr:allatostatin-A receptor isoform X1 [Drosophila gunungcola]
MDNITVSAAEMLGNISLNASRNDENLTSFFTDEEWLAISGTLPWIVVFFFGAIAITGFFGNLLVILVVVFNKNMRSTTNLMIVNLAAADLMFVILCIPFTATDYMVYYWPFGRFWCRSVQYLIVVTAFASIYTLVLMSIDRFLAVVHPIRSRMMRTENITLIAIVTLWIVVLVVSVPVAFTHDVMVVSDAKNNITYGMCMFITNDIMDSRTYHVTFFISSYMLPLMIISGLYMRMIMRLWRQGTGVRMSKESQRGRKRVTRLVIVVVIAFASLWLPVQLILLFKALGVVEMNSLPKLVIQVTAQTLAYSSSCINPLLYAFLSENFRKAFYKAINCSSRYQNYTSDLPPPRKTSCARTSTTGL